MSNADNEYKKILEDQMKKIQERINVLKSKEEKLDLFSHNSTTIKGLELEYENLKERVENYTARDSLSDFVEGKLSTLDKIYDKRNDKQEGYKEQIEELQSIKNNLETARARKKVDKKIANIEKKIKRLQKSKGFYGGIQRTIMYPKYRLDIKKANLLSHAYGRVENYEQKLRDNDAIKEMFDPNKLTDTIKERFYDLKGAYYRKRLERSEAILNEMMDKKNIVTMYGSRVTSIGKNRLNNIRNSNQNNMNVSVATI